MNAEALMDKRYDATLLPSPSDDMADDAEKIVQWLLECAFFKPFVYRNPMKDPQKEFADALIIFDDTLIIVQVKAKSSERAEAEWVSKHATKASKQLNGSYRQLKEGLVSSFTNPVFSVQKEVRISQYPYVYGIIILAGVKDAVDPLPLIDPSEKPALPSIFLSVFDLYMIAGRVNTAADFIHYCEAHSKLATYEPIHINQQEATFTRLAAQVPLLLSEGRPLESLTEKHILGFSWISRLFRGEVNNDEDYRFSLLVDDIISHSYDLDPVYSGPVAESSLQALKIAEQLSWLDRKRRIELGKLLYGIADAARDGSTRFQPYMRPPLGVLFLFMCTSEERMARREHLLAFVGLAQVKYGVTQVLGIATEPIGNGRSYDLMWVEESLVNLEASMPVEILGALPDLDRSLFGE